MRENRTADIIMLKMEHERAKKGEGNQWAF